MAASAVFFWCVGPHFGEGLAPPLSKRSSGGHEHLDQTFEEGEDAFHRFIAPAEHCSVDHHEYKQNPDQIPSIRDDHIDLLARRANRKCPTGGRAQKKPGDDPA